MKRISILSIVVLILLITTLPAAAITGGVEDGDDHPNVGLMAAFIDDEYQWRCSGTLIAPRVFLTAGHCVGDGATSASVWFDTDLTNDTDYPDGGLSGTPVPHPLYLGGGGDPHDVGVVILDEAVTDIELAALPTPDLLGILKKARVLVGGYEEGVFFRTVGYGGTLESWPPPELAYDKIRRVSESEYVALTKVHLHLSQKAVFDESGSCFGDSGGPVFWEDPDKNEIIVAVTSSGDGQCVATGFNYRVDIPYMVDWIYEHFPVEE